VHGDPSREGLERGRTEHQYIAAVTKDALPAAGLPTLDNASHIVPVMVRDADRCKAASDLLSNRLHPTTVPIGTERLRITPTPRHNEAHVSSLVDALVEVWRALGLPFTTARIVALRRPPPECVSQDRKAAEQPRAGLITGGREAMAFSPQVQRCQRS
jgi:5-aminolevulinate synthase